MRALLLLLTTLPLAGCFLFDAEADGSDAGCATDDDCAGGFVCVEGLCEEAAASGGGGGGGEIVQPPCELRASEASPREASANARYGFALATVDAGSGLLAVGAPGVCVDGLEPPGGAVQLVGGGLASPLPLERPADLPQLGAALATGWLDGQEVLVAATARLRDGNRGTRCAPTGGELPLQLAVWPKAALLLAASRGTTPDRPACVIDVPATLSDGVAAGGGVEGSDPVAGTTWTLLLPGDLDGLPGEELVIGRPEAGAVLVARGVQGCSDGARLHLREASMGGTASWPAEAPVPPELPLAGRGAALAVVRGAWGSALVVGAREAGRVERLRFDGDLLVGEELTLAAPTHGRFGAALATQEGGGVLAISAPAFDDVAAEGVVVLLDVTAGADPASWRELARIVPPRDVAPDFGSSLLFASACAGEPLLVVGAARGRVWDGTESVEAGRLFVTPVPPTSAPPAELEGYGERARLGTSLAPLAGGFAAGAPDKSVGAGYGGGVRRWQSDPR